MAFSQSLTDKLQKAFEPERLEVINESHLHAGHQEKFDGSGETHLRIRIVAEAFRGMSRLQRHRAINALADAEMAEGLHALAIEAAAPGESTIR
ncbi:MAG: BolA family transcriptional regulator [Nitratireductor sp.]|nr:BolA family transcriptional regulator [Nitratireductor sp.]MCB1456408.1 BolA family transcriptional regulator [Nitratireductor sp.]MCB1458458.1 BolA family transcriptional regulator [Nitratireductor sp.]